MVRLRPLPSRKVDRVVRRLGFVAVRSRGSHIQHQHPDGRLVTVPAHGARDASMGVLRAIMRYLNLTPEELEQLL